MFLGVEASRGCLACMGCNHFFLFMVYVYKVVCISKHISGAGRSFGAYTS